MTAEDPEKQDGDELSPTPEDDAAPSSDEEGDYEPLELDELSEADESGEGGT